MLPFDKKDLMKIDGVVKVTPKNGDDLNIESYWVEVKLPNGAILTYSVSYQVCEEVYDNIYDELDVRYSYGGLEVKLKSFDKPLEAQYLLMASLKLRQLEDWAQDKLVYCD